MITVKQFKFIFCILLISFLSGCQAGNGINLQLTPTKFDETITVAAAADLQFAFTDIANLYEQQTGRKVILVFGSTGQLVQQIENGASFDLVASANIEYIDRLVNQGLAISDSADLYARGRIVLATVTHISFKGGIS